MCAYFRVQGSLPPSFCDAPSRNGVYNGPIVLTGRGHALGRGRGRDGAALAASAPKTAKSTLSGCCGLGDWGSAVVGCAAICRELLTTRHLPGSFHSIPVPCTNGTYHVVRMCTPIVYNVGSAGVPMGGWEAPGRNGDGNLKL